MRFLFILATLFAISPSAWAGSKIVFSNPTHDFGKVKRGEIIRHSFEFKNTGDSPLLISGVHAACGCAVSKVDILKAYQPGETSEITITMDSSNFAGPISKVITVMSNERPMMTRTLTLKGTVAEEFRAHPPVIDLSQVTPNSIKEYTARIVNLNKVAWPDFSVRYNEKALSVRHEKSGDDLVLYVKLKEGTDAGFIKEAIMVATPSQHLRHLPILVRGNVRGNIHIGTQYLEFGSLDPQQVVSRTVNFETSGDYTINGSTVELNVNGERIEQPAEAVVTQIDKQSINIALKNSRPWRGSAHGRIQLATTDPSQKLLTLDFYAFFKNEELKQ